MNGKEVFLNRIEKEDYSGLTSDLEENCTPDQDGEGEHMRCRAGKCSGWVTWNGNFGMCGMIPEENAPNVFEDGFLNAWRQVTEKAASIRLPAACRECSLKESCKPCAAMAYTETGAYDKVPEYRCRMAHAYAGEALRLAKEIRERNTEDHR